MRLHEYFEKMYESGPADIHTNITFDGKYDYGNNESVSIEGYDITPLDCVFKIASILSNSTVYKNHYFENLNNRRNITHKVSDGKTHIVHFKDFVRKSQP